MKGFDFFILLQPVELPVEQHSLAAARDVLLGEKQFQIALDLAIVYPLIFADLRSYFSIPIGKQLCEFVFLQFLNGFVENLLIGFVPQIGDKTALLRSQQIACAPNIQILHCQMDSASQIAEVLDRLQPTSRLRGERFRRRRQQETKGLLIASPHPPAQLVQIAQPEMLGVMDDHRIRIRDIDPVFHDGGRQQDIVIVVHETRYHLFQLFGIHLPVADGYPTIRDISQNHGLQVGQLLNTIAHEEDLSVSAHFEVDSLDNRLFVEGKHLRLNRIAIGRRRLNHRQVARAHQGELQGSGDRGGRHGKRIDIDFQLPELFLHTDSELLFLIDNQQSQIFKCHRFADQLVGTDYHINLPLRQFSLDSRRIAGRAGPGQIIHFAGKIFQAIEKSMIMLISQNSRRH